MNGSHGTPRARLHPAWRALIGLGAGMALAFFFVPILIFTVAGESGLVFEAAYRLLGALALAVTFMALARKLDGAETNAAAYTGIAVDRRAVTDAAAGLLLGFLMVTTAVAAIAIFGDLHMRATLTPRTLLRAAAVLGVIAGGAALEELLTRGYPFHRLVEAIGPTLSILAFAVGFGLMHIGNPNAGPIAIFNTAAVGAVLALAYLRTRSLWLPIGLHAGWNATLGLLYGLPVSGLTMFSQVTKSRAAGPAWLTGGRYGIEASLTATLVIALGALPILWMVRQRPKVMPVAEQAPSVRIEMSEQDGSGIQSS